MAVHIGSAGLNHFIREIHHGCDCLDIFKGTTNMHLRCALFHLLVTHKPSRHHKKPTHQQTHPQASKAPFASKIQQCFAVKANVDSFLDLARATFCRLTESVHELADKYRATYGQQGQQGQQGPIKVSYSHKKGFYLVVPEQGSAGAGAGSKKRGQQGSGASEGWELPK